jgi:hypothetical protein
MYNIKNHKQNNASIEQFLLYSLIDIEFFSRNAVSNAIFLFSADVLSLIFKISYTPGEGGKFSNFIFSCKTLWKNQYLYNNLPT